MKRGPLIAWALVVLLLGTGQRAVVSAQSSDADADRYEAQSQYMRSFVEFVSWPSDPAKQQARSTINFCVLGNDPYGKLLDDTILGHSFGKRQGVIVRGRRLEDLGACDVLFLGKSEEKNEDKILQKLRNKGVLTISDMSGFAARGGIIQFVREKDHLGFLINVDAASRAGLQINASLLALAQIVHDGPSKAAP